MGFGSSKSKPVTPEPISTTVTVRTTVQTSTAAFPDSGGMSHSGGKSLIDNPEIFYLALAFISGILSTLVVVGVSYLIRKRCKRSQENLQEQVPSQTPCEESAENTQNEVSYASVVLKPRPKAALV